MRRRSRMPSHSRVSRPSTRTAPEAGQDQAIDQLENRALPGAAASDEDDDFAGLDGKVQPVEQLRTIWIAEAGGFELHDGRRTHCASTRKSEVSNLKSQYGTFRPRTSEFGQVTGRPAKHSTFFVLRSSFCVLGSAFANGARQNAERRTRRATEAARA